MRPFLLVLACVAALPAAALANPPSASYGREVITAPWPSTHINPRTGAQVTVVRETFGPTFMTVKNPQTGLKWSVQVFGPGDLKGVDAAGNHWTYKASARTYFNDATGARCTGHSWEHLCA